MQRLNRILLLGAIVLSSCTSSSALTANSQAADGQATDGEVINSATNREVGTGSGNDEASTDRSLSSPNKASTTTTSAAPPSSAFFLWVPRGLPDSAEADIRELPGVVGTSVVLSGTFHVTATIATDGSVKQEPPDGFVVPVEGQVITPVDYLPFLDERSADALAALDETGVVLTKTSAELRAASKGDAIRFENGVELTVMAILDDAILGSTEILVTNSELFVPGADPREIVLIDFDGPEEELITHLEGVLPDGTRARIGQRGTSVLSQTGSREDQTGSREDQTGSREDQTGSREDQTGSRGASTPQRLVRSQLYIKQRFGEFAYQVGSGGSFRIDPEWVEANIVDVDIPLLGRGKCHREFAEILTAVMDDLIADGRDDLVDSYSGCWNARYIAGSTRLSHHAWGIAVDMNFFNPEDDRPGSPVHPELLRRMEAQAGLVSGHRFTTPDPGHFEFYDPK